jgi:hypothetical protein
MPRQDIDRGAFVGEIAARWKKAHFRARLGHNLLRRGPSTQTLAYEMTFRSDEEAVSYYYALCNDHVPDLSDPTWLNEKIRWQFLHHRNPLMAYCADKLSVRDYLRFKGAESRAPSLIAWGASADEFLDADLPSRYVLKSTHGCAQYHFERPEAQTPRTKLRRQIARWLIFDRWRRTGEMHYRDMPKRWIVEEVIGEQEDLLEIKVFCSMGQPLYCLVTSERTGHEYRYGLVDMNWHPVPFHRRGYKPTDFDVARPKGLDQIISDARKLSEDFLHVRVDFMLSGDTIYLSELTFAGGAARIPFEPREVNRMMGDLIDLGRADELLERGRQITGVLDPSRSVRRAAGAAVARGFRSGTRSQHPSPPAASTPQSAAM